jgi:mono/diheme cytochrome c family protein
MIFAAAILLSVTFGLQVENASDEPADLKTSVGTETAGSVAVAATGKSGAVTFARDVAPILQKRCAECHHQGGVAPMSLVGYEETRPWARAIKEKVVKREMPPFHAAGPVGRYVNDPRLTDSEIAVITKWVDSGAPKGNSKDQPAPRTWTNDWSHGEPDLVVKVAKPYTIRPSQKDQYVFFVFDYVFPEDTWLNGVATRPGNPRAVHHANTHVVPPMIPVPPEGYIAGDFDPTARGTVMMSGWAPGVGTVILPEGTGVRIPKGMRLGIQIHYAPSDQERVDQTAVGLYFIDGVVKKHIQVLMGDRKDVQIPPGDANYSLASKKTFEQDAKILFYHVHMHLRGKSYLMRLKYPDGREEVALEVPRYDFNWQRVYTPVETKLVPKGTQVDFIGTYDNSAANKFNPDPTQLVRWGEKTTDEMMQGRIFYEFVDQNLNLQVKKGRVLPAQAATKE